jgi:hypothetical protein
LSKDRQHGADRGDVGIEVAAERRLVQLREGQRIESLIAIGHVHGKHPPDVGYVDRYALRFVYSPVLAPLA